MCLKRALPLLFLFPFCVQFQSLLGGFTPDNVLPAFSDPPPPPIGEPMASGMAFDFSSPAIFFSNLHFVKVT